MAHIEVLINEEICFGIQVYVSKKKKSQRFITSCFFLKNLKTLDEVVQLFIYLFIDGYFGIPAPNLLPWTKYLKDSQEL